MSFRTLLLRDWELNFFYQVATINLSTEPCDLVLKKFPPRDCISKNFTELWPVLGSCEKKQSSNDDQCCYGKCLFLESGLLVEEKLNKSLLTSWLSQTSDSQNPQILGLIDQCEAIRKLFYLNREHFHIFHCFQSNKFHPAE